MLAVKDTLAIIVLFTVTAAISAPAPKSFWVGAHNRFVRTGHNQPHGNLGKNSSASSLQWRQTGTTHYSTSDTGNSPTWKLTSRDTVVFDANGNEALFKKSRAATGWAIDSLEYSDSSVYNEGNLVESVFISYYERPPVPSERTAYAYLADGKISVYTVFNWIDSKKTWRPYFKDSTIFSSGNYYQANIDPRSSESVCAGLVGMYQFAYDTLSSKWISKNYCYKISDECTATTFTLGEKVLYGGRADTLFDEKTIYTFGSSPWTTGTETQEISLLLNTSTGKYDNSGRDTFFTDANRRRTGDMSFYWSSATKNWAYSLKHVSILDSFGNDTLKVSFSCKTGASTWDTIQMQRTTRTYDGHGNLVQVVFSTYSPISHSWQFSDKDVNTFAQINTPVLYSVKKAEHKNIIVTITEKRITVKAPDITGFILLDATGRTIQSITQKPAGSISVDLSAEKKHISSGICIAKLLQGNQQSYLKLPMQRKNAGF